MTTPEPHQPTPNDPHTATPAGVFVLYTDLHTSPSTATLARTPHGAPAHPTRVEREVITELLTTHFITDNAEARLVLVYRSTTHPATFDVHIHTPWHHLHHTDYDPGVEDFESHIGDYLYPSSLGDGSYLFTDPEGVLLFEEQFHRGTHWLLNCDPTSIDDTTTDAHHYTTRLVDFYNHYLTQPTIPPAHAETITTTLHWWNQQTHT